VGSVAGLVAWSAWPAGTAVLGEGLLEGRKGRGAPHTRRGRSRARMGCSVVCGCRAAAALERRVEATRRADAPHSARRGAPRGRGTRATRHAARRSGACGGPGRARRRGLCSARAAERGPVVARGASRCRRQPRLQGAARRCRQRSPERARARGASSNSRAARVESQPGPTGGVEPRRVSAYQGSRSCRGLRSGSAHPPAFDTHMACGATRHTSRTAPRGHRWAWTGMAALRGVGVRERVGDEWGRAVREGRTSRGRAAGERWTCGARGARRAVGARARRRAPMRARERSAGGSTT